MKRVLCIVMALMLFGGCGTLNKKDVKKEPLIFSGFNAVVTTKINDITISGKAEYYADNSLTFEFSQPETVKGATVVCSSGEYKIRFQDISVSFPSEKMSFYMICRAIETCVNNVQGKTPENDAESEMLVYSYTAENHLCKLYADSETKNFIKLTVDGVDVVYFENFQYLTTE